MLGEGEWLASDIEGCEVVGLGRVARVLDLPSCAVLELEDGTLVPFVSRRGARVRPGGPAHRGGPRLPGRTVNIDVLTLFPSWFGWFAEQRHVRNAAELGHRLEAVDLRASTPLKSGQVDDTPYGGGAGMVIRVDVVEAALRARYGVDPRSSGRSGGWWRWPRAGAGSTTPSRRSSPPSPS